MGKTLSKYEGKINKINNSFSEIHEVAYTSTVFALNWNLKMLVFLEGGKPDYPEKDRRSKDENQEQTQPTGKLSPLCHP